MFPQEWAKHGVQRSWFPTIDYQPPSLHSISEGVRVIEECKRRQESVYVHCKAGKGRSAMVATCYLIKVSIDCYRCFGEGDLPVLQWSFTMESLEFYNGISGMLRANHCRETVVLQASQPIIAVLDVLYHQDSLV